MSKRSLICAVTFGLFAGLVLPSSGSAATTKFIQELDFVFTPDPVTVHIGDTMTWRNQVKNLHTTTDLSPLLLWDSGLMSQGATYSYTVTAAGTYPYFCQLHERFGMYGTFQASDFATPRMGPVGTLFTVEVATVPAPTDFIYDIQKRDPAGGFASWISTPDGSVIFDSTGQPPGIYQFRSRQRRLSDGSVGKYSPPIAILVQSTQPPAAA
jgi:plastocyanin